MLKLVVSDDFVDIISSMPAMCMNKIFKSIIAFDTVSQNEADKFQSKKLKEFYDRINNQ